MASRDLRNIGHALLLVAAVLALIAAALWFRGGPLEPQVLALPKALSTEDPGIPDSGKQRQMIVAELKQLNNRLQAVEAGLRDGKYLVQTKPAPGEGGADAGAGK